MELLNRGAAGLGLELTQDQIEQFEVFYRELVEWNRKTNLTAITDYEDVQVRHFLDSLTVVLAIGRPVADARIIDIGSGAGLPGIPVKIAFPAARMTLLEATGKKVKFLEHLVSALSLPDVEVVNDRAEELGHNPLYRERFDLALCRAVAALPVLAELCLPFNVIGGRMVAWKKGDIRVEIEQARRAAVSLGGCVDRTVPVDVEGLRDGRCLVVAEKISTAPPEYPRRPGRPARRPLG